MWPNYTLNGTQRAGFEMADLNKQKKVRGTTRASASRLIARYKDILQENYGDQEVELMVILDSLKGKQSELKKINWDIVELLSEY